MSFIRLGDRSLPDGATVVDLVFELDISGRGSPRIENQGVTGLEPRLLLNKPLFSLDEILHDVAPRPGDNVINWTANFSLKGTTPSHMFGFKQIALHLGTTVVYSGLKNVDGAIVESSSGVNFTSILDVTPKVDASLPTLTAPQAPFYMELPAVFFIKPGLKVALSAADAPGGSHPLRRQNHLTDRPNFLDSGHMASDFVTFLVVQMPDSSHVAVAGFSWRFEADGQVQWTKGIPTASGEIKIDFRTAMVRGDLNPEQTAIFENPRLGFADSIVFRVNKARIAVEQALKDSPGDLRLGRGRASTGPGAISRINRGDWEIDQFETFQPLPNIPFVPGFLVKTAL